MGLVSSLVGRLETPVEGGKSFGTVYPIAAGYILTAYHVFPDINDLTKSKVFWQHNDKAKDGDLLPDGVQITRVIYQSEQDKYDIVIAECKTPDQVKKVVFCDGLSQLSSKEKVIPWESIGFPKAGQDYRLKRRLKDPAWGTFGPSLDDDWIQTLESTADTSEVMLWKGMSGAPVFIKGTNYLAGIIVGTPKKYLTDDQAKEPVYNNRLYALSFPYLIAKCTEFNAKLKEIHHHDNLLEQDHYFSLAEFILNQPDIFTRLQQLCSETPTSPRELFDSLVSLTIGEFFSYLENCQKQGVCHQTLGQLAEILLPVFVDTDAVTKVRDYADIRIVAVPYVKKSVIESLMARVDRLGTEFLGIGNQGEFIAAYALPDAPESGGEDDHRVRTMGQHLSAQFGQDLQRFARHTRHLLRNAGMGDIQSKLGGQTVTRIAKQQLELDRENGKRRYYLISDNNSDDSGYYQKLKTEYPLCAIVERLPLSDEQLLKEIRDYNKAHALFSPYLNQKKQDDS